MLKSLLGQIFGTRHEREAKKLMPIVDQINASVAELSALSEDEFRGQTAKLKSIVEERTGELNAELAALRERKRSTEDAEEREQLGVEMRQLEERLKTETQGVLDDILPEAFA